MARANSSNALYFGFASAALLRDGQVVGQSEIVGNFTAEVSPELADTQGGASSYSVAARLTRASGDGTLVLRERPDWIELELAGGSNAITAADSNVVAGSITDVVGSTIASAVSVTTSSSVNAYMDFELTAVGTSAVDVRVNGNNGSQLFENVALTSTATAIGQTGVSLTAASANFTTDPANKAIFAVTPAHGGVHVLSVPQVRVGQEYELRLYTAIGGGDDALHCYTFPRVFFRGANLGATDIETGEVEIPFKLLAPTDGGSIYTLRKVLAA